MNNIETARQQIKDCGIIAILRGGYSTDDLLRIGEALLAGTITVMEITLNSPSALTALPQLRQQFGDTMLIGAGTVRFSSQVRHAVDAGAQFLVSPNFDAETVAVARSQGVLHLPGVLTATEAQNAFAAGAQMLKLFPMDFFGPAYLKVLRGPLDDIDFVPTGGVTLENIGDYARAGAAAVGMGSQLIGSLSEITPRAIALRQIWQNSQNQ
jgi:2-dehydro-3-deoxyphosphogluconate aldolase/(4S)-4-hydroxy-2-oxoglutarate aldolase